MSRPRILKRKRELSVSTSSVHSSPSKSPTKLTNYDFIPITPTRRTPRARPLVFLADGQTRTQRPRLAHPVGQVGLCEPPLNSRDVHVSHRAEAADAPDVIEPIVFNIPESRHHMKRLRQHERWVNDVLPSLIRPFMRLLQTTSNLRRSHPTVEEHCTCMGSTIRKLSVLVVRFSRKWQYFRLFRIQFTRYLF